MNFCRFTALLGLAAAVAVARAQTTESKPPVARHLESWNALGPFLFSKELPEGGTQSGLRPFWVQTKDAHGDLRAAQFLYPVFFYSANAETYKWSVLNLVNRSGRHTGAPPPNSELEGLAGFDVWPFWFSRNTGDPATSYHALFPVVGTIKNRLGFDRLNWVAWPLYVRSESKGAVTTSTPWPFVRITRGTEQGFALWPLYTWKERPGVWRKEVYLWPLSYNNTTQPPDDAPAGTPPVREYAALPFYAHASGPGYRGETYLWPFFGYTNRTAPERYHETRYLWPFLVQGRGESQTINRWAPLYSYSSMHGYEKTWIAWPLLRELRWTSDGVAQTKTQLLYFLYWSRVQRSPTNPRLPAASITHYWPLLSTWDNGAGRRQWQFPSPLEVFFPGNEKVRAAWTPLFALIRYDQRAPGDERTSILWDGVTWERHAAEERIVIANGLVTFHRTARDRWRTFWLDFRSKPTNVASAVSP